MSDNPKSALVTGGAKRIGAAIVRELHRAGCNVVIHCNRSRAEADALAAELARDRPDSTTVLQADLRDDEALATLAAGATAAWDGLDLLVNNASTFYPTPVGSVTATQWDELMGPNLRAPFFLAQHLADTLRRRRGAIINIVDIHGRQPMKGHPVYCAAKAGLEMLTRSLARELGPEICVNGVSPGAILWPEHDMDEALQQRIIAATALKRAGEPDDVARMVRFLGLEAGYVTGQIVAVDGGRSLHM
jgi:pteridine reductase